MAKFEKSDYKKHQNFYSILGKIGDILFYPIILITLICVAVIFTAKDNNKVPTILGFSIVKIQSPSMVAADFEIGDTVFALKKKPEKLRCGDIIAFYRAEISPTDLTLIQSYDIKEEKVIEPFNGQKFNELRSQKREPAPETLAKSKDINNIFFHRIVAIYMTKDGTIYYQTQGDSNATQDSGYAHESMVITKYITTPMFVRDVFKFIATPNGMIVTIVAPLCIVTLFQLFSIIEQLSRIGIERRVLRRELRYDDPESIKANIGIEMEISDKAKFYATTEEEEKQAVSNFLWGHMSKDPKQKLNYQGIINSLKYLDGNANKYWLYFLGSTQSKRERKLIHKAWQEWITEEKVKEVNKKRQKKTPEKTTKPGVKIKGKKAPQKPKRVNDYEKK